MSVSVFGIRHHGPGSARSLVGALHALGPDIVLVEGPPEGDSAVSLASHPDMVPPVALLVYDTETPSRSVFYPFAVFSPEWQAIQYALQHQIPVRFIDLSVGVRLNLKRGRSPEDPLQQLAAAAGYSDSERWWEHMVEERQDDRQLFDAILAAMAALRPDPLETEDDMEAMREATMRLAIRQAEKQGFARIAVVCGAWHAPALVATVPVSKDAARVKGHRKVRTEATWVPWTYGRLALESGYGAGLESPGWYQHLWQSPGDVTVSWMARVATMLRSEELEASPAQTVDAVRLAEALSALRDRPRPGLPEMNDAAVAVFSFGQTVPLQLIRDRLIIGEALGRVPDDTPQVALARDLARLQKRLRLPPQATVRDLDLDLRSDTDRQRSLLLHQLTVLEVGWGKRQAITGKSGTFHEVWRLQWRPELSVAVVSASVWGNTVLDAAQAMARDKLMRADELAVVTRLLHDLLLAGLSDVVPDAVHRLEDLAALAVDVVALMRAVPALARVVRYGNVRQTDTSAAHHMLDGMLVRICIGLPPACVSLSAEAAHDMVTAINGVDDAVGLLERADDQVRWEAALVEVSSGSSLVAGRVCGLLQDRQVWNADAVRRRLGLALSTASQPPQAAAWVEGFLSGRGALLIHDEHLRTLLDEWVCCLDEAVFAALLPLLRRTFSTFAAAERRQLGERLTEAPRARELDWDPDRMAAAVPLLRQLLT